MCLFIYFIYFIALPTTEARAELQWLSLCTWSHQSQRWFLVMSSALSEAVQHLGRRSCFILGTNAYRCFKRWKTMFVFLQPAAKRHYEYLNVPSMKQRTHYVAANSKKLRMCSMQEITQYRMFFFFNNMRLVIYLFPPTVEASWVVWNDINQCCLYLLCARAYASKQTGLMNVSWQWPKDKTKKTCLCIPTVISLLKTQPHGRIWIFDELP